MTNFDPSEDQISGWLSDNPGFFTRQTDLVKQLRIPHAAGTASLLEHQVAVLRAENEELRQKLDRLSGVAGQNERLLGRLHRVGLQIVAATSLDEMFERLDQTLRNEFNADALRLMLPPSLAAAFDSDQVVALDDKKSPDWLRELRESNTPQCGRLTSEKREAVFDQAGGDLGSVALIPIDDFGLMAIGSSDDNRFQPEMGTLFLEQLGQSVSFRLTRDGQDRAARG